MMLTVLKSQKTGSTATMVDTQTGLVYELQWWLNPGNHMSAVELTIGRVENTRSDVGIYGPNVWFKNHNALDAWEQLSFEIGIGLTKSNIEWMTNVLAMTTEALNAVGGG